MFRRYWILTSVAVISAMPARAEFSSCKQGLIAEAVRDGISEKTAEAALGDVRADPKILELERVQPEFKTPIWDYLAALVDDERVSDGKAAMAANAKALSLAERKFGVSKYILAAIWGVESNFGRNMGDRPLARSLTNLACLASRRPQYFRRELIAMLKIADKGDIPLEKLKGSWAGAFGQTQFMPSTFLKLAVDLDGSGRDIIDNSAAALGSTANYFKRSGWSTGETWGFEVELPADYDGPSGRKNQHPIAFWANRGIRRVNGEPLSGGISGLLLPAGKRGPAFLVSHNFDVIYSYNASESYALAAAILAQRLAGGPGILGSWPTDDPGLSRVERRELQKLLARRGYDVGSPDGAIGEKTRTAIADFQQRIGLTVNGRASRKVLDRLRD
jgi:lytic murein transglycosylase